MKSVVNNKVKSENMLGIIIEWSDLIVVVEIISLMFQVVYIYMKTNLSLFLGIMAAVIIIFSFISVFAKEVEAKKDKKLGMLINFILAIALLILNIVSIVGCINIA